MQKEAISINVRDLTLTLRSLKADDASAALSFMQKMYSTSLYLTRYADEWNLSVEEEASFIELNRSADDLLLLGIFDADHLLAIGSWAPVGRTCRLRHRCTTSIAVDPHHQGKGIGEALMGHLIESARQAGFEQMELEVVGDNTAAVHLYEKLGFTQYGTLKRGFRNRDGSYADLVAMVLTL